MCASTCRSTRARPWSTAPAFDLKAAAVGAVGARRPCAVGRPRARERRPARRARRAWCRRLQGVHVGERDRRVPTCRRRHAPRGDDPGRRARPARRRPRGERRADHAARGRARSRRVASRCATISTRDPSRRSWRRSAARSRSPRDTNCRLHVVHVSHGSWCRRRRGGAGARRRRQLRDVPALPPAHRRGRRAARRAREVRAAAPRRPTTRRSCGARSSRGTSTRSARIILRARRSSSRATRSRPGVAISGCQTTLGRARHGRTGPGSVPGPRRDADVRRPSPTRFGLAGKGRIEVGADADLALVDLGAEWTLDRRRARVPPPAQPVRRPHASGGGSRARSCAA